MRKINPWAAAGVAAVVLSLGTTAAFASGVGNADDSPATIGITNPTQQQALDANQTVQNYIQNHPDAVSPTTPPATTTPPASPTTTSASPTVSPADSTLPSNFKATAGDQKIVLSWAKPTGGTPTGYIYGRGGVDSTGYGAYDSPVQPTTTLSVTLDKLVNGTTYPVYVEAVYSTGNKRISTTAIPSAPTPTATPTSTSASPTGSASPTTPPASGRVSGLAWNSGVWNDQQPDQTNAFVSSVRGGKNVDNILVYTTRTNLTSENNPAAWKAALPATFNGVKQDLVLALTTWTSDGAFMTQAQGQAIGTSVCSVDGTTPVVRLDWEMNLADGAGSNGAALTASNYTAWVARFRAVATGLKAGCSGLKIDFNPNHGADQTAGCNTSPVTTMCTRRAFQALKDVVDIYGVDTYDSYPPVLASNSGWGYRTNAANTNELENARAYAVANGKKFSVPEWGTACNSSGCQWQGNAGGDDPNYAHQMLAWFNTHASDMAYETYFNEPATYIISDLIGANPNTRAQYRSDILALAS
jgi:hypothetical protein